MEFPKRSKTCESHRRATAQAGDCPDCLELNKEICALCGKQVLYNNFLTEGGIPGVCQCFFSESDNSDAASNARGSVQTERPATEICDSLRRNLFPPLKKSTNITEKDFLGGNEESEIQLSHSSNGYLSSLDEMSSFQNITARKNKSSPSSGEDSKKSNAAKSYSSSGYPLSLSEKSSDQSLSDYRNIASQSSGGYKSNLNTERETSLDESLINSDKLNDQYMYNEESQSDRKSINSKLSKNEQNEKGLSTEVEKFIFNNPDIKISSVRPVLPRPFPQHPIQPQSYQPYQLFPPTVTTPSLNMPISTPYLQIHRQPYSHLQSYTNTVMTKPVIQTNVSGRFPVSSRPQLNIRYHPDPQHDGSKGLSKKLLAQAQTQQDGSKQSDTKKERIKDWLEEVELVPPEEQPSDSGWASGWSVASNEENEGIPPIFSGTSTDERSSTEISEEENRRQRLLRRPPRFNKKR